MVGERSVNMVNHFLELTAKEIKTIVGNLCDKRVHLQLQVWHFIVQCYVCVCLSVHPSVCLSVSVSMYLYPCLSVCVYVCTYECKYAWHVHTWVCVFYHTIPTCLAGVI